MRDTNRSSLLSHAEYDSILAINDRLLANASTCIMYGFLPTATLVDNLCEKWGFSCEKCIQEWLNEPDSGWNNRLETPPKTVSDTSERGKWNTRR